MDDMSMLLAIFGAFMLLFLVVGIILYILLAIGLYGIAKNEKIENAWFAWIPLLQLYIIGKVLKEIKIAGYTITKLEIILPVTPIAIGILSAIPVIGQLLGLAYFIFSILVMYQFFKMYKGDKAVLMTVLSTILFFMGPIYIFTLRNASPLMSPESFPDIE